MTNSPKTIGACLIVKDEAAVIERCLDSLRPLVDYVMVHDTGSIDNTMDLIRDWCARNNFKYSMRTIDWLDFATNRSWVLEWMRNSMPAIDYAFIIDADDVLEIAPGIDIVAWKASLTADYYNINIRLDTITYHRVQMVRNALPFKYRGVVHEFIDVPDGATAGDAPGLTIVCGRGGARSRDPDKYQRDALALEAALATETDPFMRSRYTFYLAQSLRDCGRINEAIPHYLARADMDYWDEERYVALLSAGRIEADTAAKLSHFARATALVPTRAEALHAAAFECRMAERWADACGYAERGLAIPKPATGLFLEHWVYDYGLLDELAISAHYARRYRQAYEANDRILNERHMPGEMRGRIRENLRFAKNAMESLTWPVGIDAAPVHTGDIWVLKRADPARAVWQVCAVDLPGYPHAAGLSELVEAVFHGLVQLGYLVELIREVEHISDRCIIIGAHLFTPDECDAVPAEAIVYNSERADGPLVTDHYRALLARCTVWDYTEGNMPAARYVPMGYVPSFTRVVHAAEKDIDVLFYGSPSPRREAVLDDLRGRGLSVHHAFGVYGRERDALIGRAKVVLNMHYAEGAPFEIVRVGYLLANGCCVVSEGAELERTPDGFEYGVYWSDHVDLGAACVDLCADPNNRATYGEWGYDVFTARNEAVILRAALAAEGRT